MRREDEAPSPHDAPTARDLLNEIHEALNRPLPLRRRLHDRWRSFVRRLRR